MISRKRQPQVSSPEQQRAFSQVYDDLNEIIDSVNRSSSGLQSNSEGRPGDLRVLIGADNQPYLGIRTINGWAESHPGAFYFPGPNAGELRYTSNKNAEGFSISGGQRVRRTLVVDKDATISNLIPGLGGSEPYIAPGNTAQFWRGDKTWQDFNAAARGAISAVAPVQYNSTSGQISILDAGPAQSGVVNTGAQTFGGTKTFAEIIVTGAVTLSSLTASRLVATDANKGLVSTITAANLLSSVSGTTGTAGNLVFSASPTFTGTVAGAALNFSGTGTFGASSVVVGASNTAKIILRGANASEVAGEVAVAENGDQLYLLSAENIIATLDNDASGSNHFFDIRDNGAGGTSLFKVAANGITATPSLSVTGAGTFGGAGLFAANVGIGTSAANRDVNVPAGSFALTIHGTGTGDDGYIRFGNETDGTWWSVGSDGGNSDRFSIARAGALGSGDKFYITTAGVITVADDVISSGGEFEASTSDQSPASGKGHLGGSSSYGAVLYGQGSSYDASIWNKSRAAVLRVPTGTINLEALGSLTVAGTLNAQAVDLNGVDNMIRMRAPGTGWAYLEIYKNSSTRIWAVGKDDGNHDHVWYNDVNGYVMRLTQTGDLTVAGAASVGTKVHSAQAIGSFGSGFQLDYNQEQPNQSTLQIDNVLVRGTLRAHIFQKDILRVINGNVVISDATTTTAEATYSGTTLSLSLREAVFQNNDIVQISEYEEAAGLTIKNAIGYVSSGGGTTSITITFTGFAPPPNPTTFGVGTTVARVGATGGGQRSGYILLTSNTSTVPRIDIIADRTALAVPTPALRIGQLSGNTFGIQGNVGGSEVFHIDQGTANIAGWLFNTTSLYKTNGNYEARLENSGSLAQLNIRENIASTWYDVARIGAFTMPSMSSLPVTNRITDNGTSATNWTFTDSASLDALHNSVNNYMEFASVGSTATTAYIRRTLGVTNIRGKIIKLVFKWWTANTNTIFNSLTVRIAIGTESNTPATVDQLAYTIISEPANTSAQTVTLECFVPSYATSLYIVFACARNSIAQSNSLRIDDLTVDTYDRSKVFINTDGVRIYTHSLHDVNLAGQVESVIPYQRAVRMGIGSSTQWQFYVPPDVSDLYLLYNGASRGYFNSSTGAYTSTSDETLKQGIVAIPDISARMRALTPIAFRYKWQDGSKEPVIFGFSAQDVQRQFPNVVFTTGDGNLSLDYQQMIPLLLRYIQALERRVATLESP